MFSTANVMSMTLQKKGSKIRIKRLTAVDTLPTHAHTRNVTSAGWQVTLCDPMWHESSRSGVATLRTAIHLLLTYLLTYTHTHARTHLL